MQKIVIGISTCLALVGCGSTTLGHPPTGPKPVEVQGPKGIEWKSAITKVKAAKSITSLAWKPDGTQVAVLYRDGFDEQSNEVAALYDPISGALQNQFYRKPNTPNSQKQCVAATVLEWSPNGQYALCGSSIAEYGGLYDPQLNPIPSQFSSEVIYKADWSKDSTKLLVARRSHVLDPVSSIQVITVPEGNVLFSTSANYAVVSAAKWSPDGSKFVLVINGVLTIYSATGELLYTSGENQDEPYYVPSSVSWQADSKSLVFSTVQALNLKDLRPQIVNSTAAISSIDIETMTFKLLWTPEYEFNQSSPVVSHPIEKVLAIGDSQGKIHLHEPSTGLELASFEAINPPGVAIQSLKWSSNGQQLLVSYADQTVRVVDYTNQKILSQLRTGLDGHENSNIYQVAFSPDGATFATAGRDQTVRLWSVASHQQQQFLTGHTGPVYSVAYSPDGTLLASAGTDGTIQLWNLMHNPPLLATTLVGHTYTIRSLAFSPDGTTLTSGSWDGSVRLWDISNSTTVRQLKEHAGFVNSVAYSPDGQLLATASSDHTIKLWDPATGNAIRTLVGHTDPVLSISWSPDGQFIASTGAFGDRTVRVWQASTGQLLHTFKGSLDAVRAVVWTKDSQSLFAAGDEGAIMAWNVPTETLFFKHQTQANQPIFGLSLSKDEKELVTTTQNGVIDIWNVQ